MKKIPLIEYARQHGRDPSTARQMARRGGFQTAEKFGRDWFIDPDEPYPDGRSREARALREQRNK